MKVKEKPFSPDWESRMLFQCLKLQSSLLSYDLWFLVILTYHNRIWQLFWQTKIEFDSRWKKPFETKHTASRNAVMCMLWWAERALLCWFIYADVFSCRRRSASRFWGEKVAAFVVSYWSCMDLQVFGVRSRVLLFSQRHQHPPSCVRAVSSSPSFDAHTSVAFFKRPLQFIK